MGRSKIKNNKSVEVIDTTEYENKQKALDRVYLDIEKKFGKGTLMKLGDSKYLNLDYIETGTLGLDIALGIGGLPKGRVIEIYGHESGGKTTVCLHIIAEIQKRGGIAAFMDAENSLDPEYASALGVDINNLVVSQPDTGEQCLDITEALVRSGAVDLIVIDSVAALVPKAEMDGEMGASHVGLHARLLSKALRKLTGIAQKTNTTIIFINQVREKVGPVYGSPEVTTGGRALKYWSSIRMDIRRVDTVKSGGEIKGSRVRIKIVKNKVAPPFKQCEFDIIYGEGISKIDEIIDIGANLGLIHKGGSWYSYNDIKLGQGKENAKKFFIENENILNEIENKIREHYFNNDEL